MVCETPHKDSLIGSNLIAYHVDGNVADNVNLNEVTAIHEIIQHLVKHGYSTENIGVISFFRAQANALEKSLIKPFPKLKGAIGTVHTFQGSERQVIILSTKVCRQQDSIAWINRRPNLLNVAVSRAKELFILVGNVHRLEETGGYTRQLVEHIREQGIILEYKTDAETNPDCFPPSSNPPIYDCDHLITLREALQEAQQELIVVSPRIEGDAAREFNREVTSVLKRGVKVTVVYGLPNRPSRDEESETHAEREIRILFAKHRDASLIRVQGEGTNERILICDAKFAVVGSWNWLSHVYLPKCQKQLITGEAQIRPEISVRISEPKTIQDIRERIDELRESL